MHRSIFCKRVNSWAYHDSKGLIFSVFSYNHMQILWLSHHAVSGINHHRVISPHCIMIFCIVTVIFPHCWSGSSRLSNWFFALLESFFSAVSHPSGILRRSVELNSCNCIVWRGMRMKKMTKMKKWWWWMNEKVWRWWRRWRKWKSDDDDEWKDMKMMKKR